MGMTHRVSRKISFLSEDDVAARPLSDSSNHNFDETDHGRDNTPGRVPVLQWDSLVQGLMTSP
jgi:hypothetical protein